MSKAIEEIVRFQKDRDLHSKEYDGVNEAINVIEEVLESLGYDVPKDNRNELKEMFGDFVYRLSSSQVTTLVNTTIEDRVNAHLDQIVFNIGSLLKLGYDPEKSLIETAKEINSRTGSMIDGKFEKDLSDEAKENWHKVDYSDCLDLSSEDGIKHYIEKR
jgi:hypothetical protein